MKKVEAFIRHEAFEPIRQELLERGVPSLSISEVKGSGRQKGVVEHYRGASLTVNVRPKLKIECVVDDAEKELVVEDGERLAASLRRGGVEAEAVVLYGKGAPVAKTLQDGAREHGCGLIAMGGYGHSRVRDFVMGGATEGVLKTLSLPVMLSH